MDLHGVAIGGGIIGKHVQFASRDNLSKLPYYDAAQSDFQIYPAVPVNASMSLRWRFWGLR